METFCFIDFETTGFLKGGAVVTEGQGRACQVAMLLTDETGRSLAEYCTLIKPDGWTVGKEALAVHGFTNEICENYGVNFRTACGFYKFMAEKTDFFIAHNADFDKDFMEVEVQYYNAMQNGLGLQMVKKPWICTMKPNTNIVKAPKKNGGAGYKWPSLEETLQFYCGRGVGEYAHDAMFDVKACRDIFFVMRAREAALKCQTA